MGEQVKDFCAHLNSCQHCLRTAGAAIATLVAVGPRRGAELESARLEIIATVATKVAAAILLGIDDCERWNGSD